MADIVRSNRVDFELVNRTALAASERVCSAFLPDGKKEGPEWVAQNPTRSDRHKGSFKVNLNTGKWADFATSDRGGDLVSLVAFVSGLKQREAAIRLSEALGLNPFV